MFNYGNCSRAIMYVTKHAFWFCNAIHVVDWTFSIFAICLRTVSCCLEQMNYLTKQMECYCSHSYQACRLLLLIINIDLMIYIGTYSQSVDCSTQITHLKPVLACVNFNKWCIKLSVLKVSVLYLITKDTYSWVDRRVRHNHC